MSSFELACEARCRLGESPVWLLDRAGRKERCLAGNPLDPQTLRFNDGGVDPRGRLLIGTIDETRRDDLKTLFVTSARGEDGAGGGLYALGVDTPGFSHPSFDEEVFAT